MSFNSLLLAFNSQCGHRKERKLSQFIPRRYKIAGKKAAERLHIRRYVMRKGYIQPGVHHLFGNLNRWFEMNIVVVSSPKIFGSSSEISSGLL